MRSREYTMNLSLHLTTIGSQINLWTLQHTAASRLFLSVMPLTLALALAVAHRNPTYLVHNYHIAPACGSKTPTRSDENRICGYSASNCAAVKS